MSHATSEKLATLRAVVRRLVSPRARSAGRRAGHLLVRGWIAAPTVGPRPPAFLGALDTPAEGSTLIGETVQIRGWAINEGHAPSRVDIFLDGQPLGRARLGIDRVDLDAFGFGSDAPFAGYELMSLLPGIADGPVVLTATAWFEGGDKRLEIGPRSLMLLRSGNSQTIGPTSRPHPPRLPAPSSTAHERPVVLVVTHQLDLGGGQLYLQELLLQLQREGLFRFVVVSMMDGALRPQLEALGIEVHLTAPWPLDNATTYEDRLTEFMAWVRDKQITAVVANTVGAFPGIHIASRLKVPSIWAIHESYPLPLLWDVYFGYQQGDPKVRAAAAAALDQADVLVFEAEATRALYATAARESRCVLIPYGVDLAVLDASAPADRTAARRELEIPDSARVLLCVGMFERRKSQLSILQAFQRVASRHPDAQLVLVGDNERPYANLVRRMARESDLGGQIRLEKVTSEILRWYRAADVLLSASDVESIPRSALEAMALGTPMLAASVYGIPELVEDGVTGWLFPERDIDALAAGMERALNASPALLAAIAARASAHVRAKHDSSGYAAAYSIILQRLTNQSPQYP